MIIKESWNGEMDETLHLWNAASLIQKYGNSTDSSLEPLKGRELEKWMISKAKLELHPDAELLKDMHGKPFWNSAEFNYPQMNYSHTKDLLFWGEHPTKRIGVDIEHHRDQIERIKHKFCTDEELEFCQNNVQQLIMVWSAKESMYKAYGGKEIDFKLDMRVWDIPSIANHSLGVFKGALKTGGHDIEFDIYFKRLTPYVLTWTLLNQP